MLWPTVLVISLNCICHVLAKLLHAGKLARDYSSTSSSDSGQASPSASSMLPYITSSTGSTSLTASTSITRTITVVTSGIGGSTTIIEFPTSSDAARDVSAVTSTLTDAGNGVAPKMGAVITTAVEYQQPISNSISQSPCSLSSGSPLTTSCSTSSSHSKHHTTRTISGGNTAETMTIQPGSFDATLIIEENVSKDIEYIEVLVSTRYNSAGGSHATIIDPNAGDQGTQTPSASPTLGSGSMNAYGMHENGNSKEDGNGKGRNSSTLVTTTKSKIHPTGSTHY